jgi:hypothetical protein
MKPNTITLIGLLLTTPFHPVFSQQVTETISFDTYISSTDNDLVNNFSGAIGLNQVTTGGITGGCVTVPLTVNWGNDNAIYCSSYLNANQHVTTTRISFLYDSTQVNGANYDRAVTLFLRPSVDYNHYVIASITYDKKIQIVSYSWVNNMPIIILQHLHWYEFILTTEVLSVSPLWQLSVNAQVTDLGLTGQLPPIPVGSSGGTFSDSIFTTDPAIEVSFTASQWGGAQVIDNFIYQGIKSPDSCTATAVNFIPESPISILYHNNTIMVQNCTPGTEIMLTGMDGRMVYQAIATEKEFSLPVSCYKPGIYVLHARMGGYISSVKIPML